MKNIHTEDILSLGLERYNSLPLITDNQINEQVGGGIIGDLAENAVTVLGKFVKNKFEDIEQKLISSNKLDKNYMGELKKMVGNKIGDLETLKKSKLDELNSLKETGMDLGKSQLEYLDKIKKEKQEQLGSFVEQGKQKLLDSMGLGSLLKSKSIDSKRMDGDGIGSCVLREIKPYLSKIPGEPEKLEDCCSNGVCRISSIAQMYKLLLNLKKITELSMPTTDEKLFNTDTKHELGHVGGGRSVDNYHKITDPLTQKVYSLDSKQGQEVLNQYMIQYNTFILKNVLHKYSNDVL